MFDTPVGERTPCGRDDVNTRSSSHSPEVAEVLHPNYMVTHIGVQFIGKHYFPVFQVGEYFLGYETTQKSFRI
jgi:hypothetical protein